MGKLKPILSNSVMKYLSQLQSIIIMENFIQHLKTCEELHSLKTLLGVR